VLKRTALRLQMLGTGYPEGGRSERGSMGGRLGMRAALGTKCKSRHQDAKPSFRPELECTNDE